MLQTCPLITNRERNTFKYEGFIWPYCVKLNDNCQIITQSSVLNIYSLRNNHIFFGQLNS